jgi:hypothetical protein
VVDGFARSPRSFKVARTTARRGAARRCDSGRVADRRTRSRRIPGPDQLPRCTLGQVLPTHQSHSKGSREITGVRLYRW